MHSTPVGSLLNHRQISLYTQNKINNTKNLRKNSSIRNKMRNQFTQCKHHKRLCRNYMRLRSTTSTRTLSHSWSLRSLNINLRSKIKNSRNLRHLNSKQKGKKETIGIEPTQKKLDNVTNLLRRQQDGQGISQVTTNSWMNSLLLQIRGSLGRGCEIQLALNETPLRKELSWYAELN